MAPSDLQQLRVLLWWEAVLTASGLCSPDQVEAGVRSGLSGLNPELTHVLRAYAKGRPPYSSDKAPRLLNAKWPIRINRVWPDQECLAWLNTPFWFLMEHRPDSSALVQCVDLLPEELQDDLLEAQRGDGLPSELSYLIRPIVYELCLDIGPARLGALACAMHRARISGQVDLERLSVVAVTWMLGWMHYRSTGRPQQLLEHLLNYFLLHAADRVYSMGVSAPVNAWDIERLGEALQEHSQWTVESELERVGR